MRNTNGIFLKEVGSKIRAIRRSKNLTMLQVGKMCSLHIGTISEIETGKFGSNILTLKAIADALKVPIKEFM